MTYGNPSIARAVQSFAAQGIEKLLVLPLYPQYCSSTTGVGRRWHQPRAQALALSAADPLHQRLSSTMAAISSALSGKIRRHWDALGERSHLLFSYHGIPVSYVAEGDPYQRQTEATTRLVVTRLGLNADGMVALLSIAIRPGGLAATLHAR